MPDQITRCPWATHSELEQDYHDHEWGIPVHDERQLFEKLNLDGLQAGLSWAIVLKKRPALRRAFVNFAPNELLRFDDSTVDALMQNTDIIRNRLKIKAVIGNAAAYRTLCAKHGSLDQFLWRYVDFRPIVNTWISTDQVPPCTPLSQTISADLKKLGFRFVGPTIVYAFMQAVGMVNDHLTSCAFYHNT
ncbi:MAG: DNA-3-methyladenine glycosylase I [Oscillospiraceae bacterium]|nr:DNA-3-methyladenine glycosylase I [Oscillospiraceae bacterium]